MLRSSLSSSGTPVQGRTSIRNGRSLYDSRRNLVHLNPSIQLYPALSASRYCTEYGIHLQVWMGIVLPFLLALQHPLLGFDLDRDNMHRLYYTFLGIQHFQANTRIRPLRQPLTIQHLYAVRSFLQTASPAADARMLWAAFTSAFFGLLRVGEYTAPTSNSVTPSTLCSWTSHSHPTVPLRLFAFPSLRQTSLVSGHTSISFACIHLCPLSAFLHYVPIQPHTPGKGVAGLKI